MAPAVLSSVPAIAIFVSSTLSIFLLCTFICSRRHRFPSLPTVAAIQSRSASAESGSSNREARVNYSESYEIATSGFCRLDLSAMDVDQTNPQVNGATDQRVEGVPVSSALYVKLTISYLVICIA